MAKCSEQLTSLFKKIPCRHQEIKHLVSIFGEKSDDTWPALFVNGHTGTGKTYVVKNLLQELMLPHAFINCAEAYSHRLFFENILDKISNSNAERFVRCENTNDFVKLLPQAIRNAKVEDETVYIVLDKAEKLRDADGNFVSFFLKLKEIVTMNVCVILISEVTWDNFRAKNACLDPLLITFSNYTKNDLRDILLLSVPDEFSSAFNEQFVNLLLRVFFQACRNVTELQYIASLLYPKYVEPVQNGETNALNGLKLFHNVEPYLKKLLRKLYLRDTYIDCLIERGAVNKKQDFTMELPFYSKYLLLASYLASYNPSMSDKRFFVKNQGKITKHSKLKTLKKNNQIQGPKTFQLDRMLAIFYSIVPEKLQPHAMVYSQISSLASLHLLSEVERSDILQTPKYKCLVSLDMIRTIAKTVDFDIIHYLYDFL